VKLNLVVDDICKQPLEAIKETLDARFEYI
jgi:hypothetical protein